jgi:hypothetical protein
LLSFAGENGLRTGNTTTRKWSYEMSTQPAAVPVFDISQYELEETGILTVQNARGDDDLLGLDGKPVTIEFYGHGSKQAVAVSRKHAQRSAARMKDLVRGKINKNEAQLAEDEEVERLSALTKTISDNFPVAPEALYSNPKLAYIKLQAQSYLNDTANFSKG